MNGNGERFCLVFREIWPRGCQRWGSDSLAWLLAASHSDVRSYVGEATLDMYVTPTEVRCDAGAGRPQNCTCARAFSTFVKLIDCFVPDSFVCLELWGRTHCVHNRKRTWDKCTCLFPRIAADKWMYWHIYVYFFFMLIRVSFIS